VFGIKHLTIRKAASRSENFLNNLFRQWRRNPITSPERRKRDPDDPNMEHRLAANTGGRLSCAPRGMRSEANSAENRHTLFLIEV
jgi:hypothetical protein